MGKKARRKKLGKPSEPTGESNPILAAEDPLYHLDPGMKALLIQAYFDKPKPINDPQSLFGTAFWSSVSGLLGGGYDFDNPSEIDPDPERVSDLEGWDDGPFW